MTLFSMLFGVQNLIGKVDKVLPIERSFKIQIPQEAVFDNSESQKVSERTTLLNYLINNKNIDKKGIVMASDISINYSDVKNKYYEVIDKTSKNELSTFIKDNIAAYSIDKYFYKSFNVKVQCGRGFDKNDFTKPNYSELPVIAGYNYKNVYKINDKIKVSNQFAYKIIGFLPKGFLMYTDGDVVGAMKNMDSTLIEPISDGDEITNCLDTIFAGRFVFSIKNKSDVNNTISDITSEIKKLGIKVEIVSFTQDIKDFKEASSSVLSVEIIENLVLVIFSISGLIASVIANINMRKKEFGILMTYGASSSNIFMIIFNELLLVMSLAYIISSLLFYNLGNRIYENQLPNSFGFYNFGLGFLSVLILLILSGLIAFFNIIKLKPSELIGGFRE
jgi:putative ABC transport system permease protein